MVPSFESGALLGHAYRLEDGAWTRLRLARISDVNAIAELLEHQAPGAGHLDARRLVQFDPRRRYVLCATGLFNSSEVLLGVGAIEFDAPLEPDLLIVAEHYRDELGPLLMRALIDAAGVIGRSRAA